MKRSPLFTFLTLVPTLVWVLGCDTGPACAPSMQISCACPGGELGVQRCRDDGSGFDECICPGMDGGTDAATDAAVVDAPLTDGGTGCAYPEETEDAPTDGTCEGEIAIVCAVGGERTRTTCADDERCVEVDVLEPADMFEGRPERRYRWASCVPAAAVECSFRYGPGFGWETSVVARCDGRDRTGCEMPLPIELQGFRETGTEQGFVVNSAFCEADEVCIDEADELRCAVGPIESCVADLARCRGERVESCEAGGRYYVSERCGRDGGTCHSVTGCGFTGLGAAQCGPPTAVLTEACTFGAFQERCAPGSSEILGCDFCGGTTSCECWVVPRECGTCRFGEPECECVVTSTTPEAGVCIPRGATRCDPAMYSPSCVGSAVRQCSNTAVIDLDCAIFGLGCVEVGGDAGCHPPAPPPCAPATPVCDASTLVGCCPPEGRFDADAFRVPCVPGREVRVDCPALPGGGLSSCMFGACVP